MSPLDRFPSRREAAPASGICTESWLARSGLGKEAQPEPGPELNRYSAMDSIEPLAHRRNTTFWASGGDWGVTLPTMALNDLDCIRRPASCCKGDQSVRLG